MNKIIIHWTAGQNIPNADDLEHYHCLYSNGLVINGNYTPEDNINCNDGKYAAHTGGLNTDSIGVAFCGMLGFNTKTKKTKYPIDSKTLECGFKHIAELVKKYEIPIEPEHILTHFEVGQKVLNGGIPRTQLTSANIGKIDITYLHAYPKLGAFEIGDFIRNKIKWYSVKIQNIESR